ncbi:prepilin peptidase, partial [bacterium]|nr:prepilin peptidase [bacterium]
MLFAAALFLAWGSFLNVVAYRLMHGPSFFVQSSFCPNCKKPLAWYDLVPVLSWLIL